MKLRHILIAALAALNLIGCAHHPDVRPGTDGVNYVIVRSTSRERAERKALGQAESFCGESDKHAYVVAEERTQYTGSMDEETRDTIHKASEVAMVVGGSAGVMAQDPAVRGVGAAVGTAGTAGAIMTSGKDYTANMKFRCQ